MDKQVKHIFRAYDVRGVYGQDIDENVMKRIGEAFGRFVKGHVAVARDARISSKSLQEGFLSGLVGSGKKVYDYGMLPLGAAMYFAWKNKKTLAYVTASHLPKEWNGVKFFHPDGCGFLEKENYKIRNAFGLKAKSKKKGTAVREDSKEILNSYIKHLSKYKAKRKIRVAIDCGNGASGIVANELFKKTGFDTEAIFEEPDGSFPNRSPDPGESDLKDLKDAVKGKDVGIAYDGDGDRMVIVDNEGHIVTPEEIAYVILWDILKKEKGPVVANVECTRLIDDIAKKFKRKVMRIPVGHTFLVQAAAKHKASFGLESSGHYILPMVVPFDDSLAVSLYFCHALSKRREKLSQIRKSIKKYPFERINFDCPDSKKFLVINKLKKDLKKKHKKINTMDGIRLDLKEGWILIRASNTSPLIRLTAEANTDEYLEKLKEKFSAIIQAATLK